MEQKGLFSHFTGIANHYTLHTIPVFFMYILSSIACTATEKFTT